MEHEAQVSLSLERRPLGLRPARGYTGFAGRTPFAPAAGPAPREWLWHRAVLGALLGLSLIGLCALLQVAPGDGQAQGPGPGKPGPSSPQLFRGWGKPDVALVLTGEQRGYLQPCGCSRPQLGGMARRYNFIEGLKQRGWPVVAVDLGDIAQRSGPQKMLKYKAAMKALDLLHYTAIGLGLNEMAMPTMEALANYTLNNPRPRVLAANLDRGQVFTGLVEPLEIARKDAPPRVGVSALIGKGVEKQVKDPDVKVQPQVLRKVLAEMKAKQTQLVVLLFQGSLKEAQDCADFCARCRAQDPTLPAVDVMLCLSDEDEPPGVPDRVGRTLIVRVGHKGRYVGVVGAFRTGQGQPAYDLRYQLVAIGEEYETPKGKEATNPVIALMEDYAREVKRGNFLTQYHRSLHPVQVAFPNAKYVGSQRCRNCHKPAHTIWEKSAHAHAYRSLENAKLPSLRQYDGECVACHVVGFAHKTGFTDEVSTPKLLNVGCESCHGPCSEHAENTDDLRIRAAINPWKADPRKVRTIDTFCQSCHDTDNDVHWDFNKNWPKVIHMTPRPGNAAQQGIPPRVGEVRIPGPSVQPYPAQPRRNP
jgi:hypothetical protein